MSILTYFLYAYFYFCNPFAGQNKKNSCTTKKFLIETVEARNAIKQLYTPIFKVFCCHVHYHFPSLYTHTSNILFEGIHKKNYLACWELGTLSTTRIGTTGIESHHSFNLLFPVPEDLLVLNAMVKLCTMRPISKNLNGITANKNVNPPIATIIVFACCHTNNKLCLSKRVAMFCYGHYIKVFQFSPRDSTLSAFEISMDHIFNIAMFSICIISWTV